MASLEDFKNLKILTAQNRCLAHLKYLDHFASSTQASPAINNVIDALRAALNKLSVILNDLSANPLLDHLDEDQIEATIHDKSRYIIYVSWIIGLIENADVTAVPGELAAPLRREIRKQFSDAELIIVAESKLNYSIVDLSAHILDLLYLLECEIPKDFPPKIFRVSIPKVECNQALLHCILAHEIGHPLYKANDIKNRIPPISVSSEKVSRLYLQLKEGLRQSGDKIGQEELPFGEIMFRVFVIKSVNTIIPNWIEEIAADIFGFLIFGPAFLLASAYFSLSIDLLNSASESHPPTRFRVKILLDLMDKDNLFPAPILLEETRKRLSSLYEISKKDISGLNFLERLAFDTIVEKEVVNEIERAIKECLPNDRQYLISKYSEEVKLLKELIDSMIPPIEYYANDNCLSSTVPGILNAGWECFLGGLCDFKKCFASTDDIDEFELSIRFNEFLIKSLELNEIKVSWDEMKNVVSCGKD